MVSRRSVLVCYTRESVQELCMSPTRRRQRIVSDRHAVLFWYTIFGKGGEKKENKKRENVDRQTCRAWWPYDGRLCANTPSSSDIVGAVRRHYNRLGKPQGRHALFPNLVTANVFYNTKNRRISSTQFAMTVYIIGSSPMVQWLGFALFTRAARVRYASNRQI